MLRILVLALLLTLCGGVLAQERTYRLGPLVIETPWARATSAGAKIGAGYAKITNTGQESDRLLGGSLPLATEVEVDETVMSNGVAKMWRIEGGLDWSRANSGTQAWWLSSDVHGVARRLERR